MRLSAPHRLWALPPVLTARLEAGFRAQTWRLVTVMIALAGAVLAGIRL
ncbi:MAG TPA: hypothetical protein VFA11_14700 [Acidimicrobiales bacterium]|nr:hypothetical protein [Acidimicrobiales bacterium]